MQKAVVVGVVLALVVGSLSCASMSKKEKGALIGAATGAVVGGVIGDKAGNTAVGVILGAAVGGTAGAYIGDYMDKQAAELDQDLEGAQVQRVGEGIKVTFDSGILFDIDKAALRPASQIELQKMAVVLNKYADTDILIEGHTDATGSEEHNLTLSRERAQSVSNYLAGLGVSPTRFTMMGYGESQPISSNETVEGRQLNRRVEVVIVANEQLKETARQKAEG
jgi:outer membrane protein OmpA-like peptidoglycan-associated protein